MARTYTLKKRAAKQAETRRRIVEAAVALHSTVGPGRTTLTMVAERAGVQRHTLYAHFPDEWDLALACSGLHLEQNPLPDPGPWKEIDDRRERLRAGLTALYGWYDQNSEIAGSVLRDAEYDDMTRRISELRFGPPYAAIVEALDAGLASEQQAMLHLALSFFTWRTLRDAGLKPEAAVDAMVGAIVCAGHAAPRAADKA